LPGCVFSSSQVPSGCCLDRSNWMASSTRWSGDLRRRGSTPGHGARRSASEPETRIAARPGRPPRRCSSAGTASFEEVLLTPASSRDGLRRATGCALVRQQPFQHPDRGRERRATEPYSTQQFHPPSSSCSPTRRATTPSTSWSK
jgi:hypothetical protein